MSDAETRWEGERKSANWGFLEDMASIGRLDMVMGDAEGTDSEPGEDSSPETDSGPEETS